MIAASIANISAGQFSGNQHKPSANLQTPQVSQSDAAELLQVSPRSVATASKVERTAPAEVIEAVKAGNISLNMAAQVAGSFFAELSLRNQYFIFHMVFTWREKGHSKVA